VAVAAIVAGEVLVGSPPARAQAFERIPSYDVAIRVERDDSIVIRETIVYDFGSQQRHGIFRDVPTTLRYDDTFDRVYPLTVLSVSGSSGTPVQYTTEAIEGGETRIKIGDPDRTITGKHTYELTYRIDHALNGFRGHDELYWNAIGDDWPVTIDRATVRVDAPGAIERIACFAGPTGSNLPCGTAKLRNGVARFAQGGLPPYQALTVAVGLPKGMVAEPKPVLRERWSVRRAFSATPPIVGASAALLALVLAGFGALVWRTGRDRRYAGSPIDVVMGAPKGTPDQAVPLFEQGTAPVEFAPPDDLRPGQMGTLLDEVANPLDVTATIVDLAVRGYLVIEEVPKEHWWGRTDWTLKRRAPADEALLEYEESLLTGLFETGDEVRVSSLKARFVDRLRKVQDALYRNASAKGWFVGRPDKVRARWRAAGVGALLVAGGLEFVAVRWTRLGLVALPLVLGGLLLTIGASWMPRRTPKGTGLVRRVKGFRTVIATAETHMARWAEQANVFTRYLPYAIVFGLTDKWAKAFEALAQEPDTSWYVSSRPFVLHEFTDSIEGFSVTSAGTIASTPSGSGGSGFGGGGSAGGGGGGGGGGSW
jgi:hypothetical protein